jgi:hypothetical protein
MSSAGWFNNYVRGRDSLYKSIERRRDRIGGGAGGISTELVAEILDDIGELKLAMATIINVLIAKGVVTDQELLAQAEVIDAMDGESDGQFTGHVQPDGKIAPDKPRARSSLDDLADAVDQADSMPE